MSRRIEVAAAFMLLLASVLGIGLGTAGADPRAGSPEQTVAVEQETPRRALHGFLDACHAGAFAQAARYMDLRSLTPRERVTRGQVLAEQLAYVLDRRDPIDASKLPDDGALRAPGASPPVVESTSVGEEPVAIAFTRIAPATEGARWFVSATTVAAIPALYAAYGPSDLEGKLPTWLRHAADQGNALWQLFAVGVAVVLSYLAAVVLAWIVLASARRATHPQHTSAAAVFFDAAARPLRILLSSLIFREIVVPLRLTSHVSSGIAQATFALITCTIAWFVIRASRAFVVWASEHLFAEPEHEIRHRVLRTHLTVVRQLFTAIVLVVAAGAVLMQFAFVRNVGLSLLASAGLVGVVIGLAAQKVLAGVIAGLQLSITQPIRIGDTVFVEKELGTIQEIHLTYVVIRLREQRMLVIPVSRFLDFPFENWTLAAPDVIGSVQLCVDFSTPVAAVRAELARACSLHDGWDGKTCSLDVTDATERTMTLRSLVSSSDASRNWALRCFVREHLIAFLGVLDGGTHLPRDRDGSPNLLGPPPGEPDSQLGRNEHATGAV